MLVRCMTYANGYLWANNQKYAICSIFILNRYDSNCLVTLFHFIIDIQ